MNLLGIEFRASDKTVSYFIKKRNIFWEENEYDYDERFEILAALFFEQAFPNRGIIITEDGLFLRNFRQIRFPLNLWYRVDGVVFPFQQQDNVLSRWLGEYPGAGIFTRPERPGEDAAAPCSGNRSGLGRKKRNPGISRRFAFYRLLPQPLQL